MRKTYWRETSGKTFDTAEGIAPATDCPRLFGAGGWFVKDGRLVRVNIAPQQRGVLGCE